MLTDLSLFTKEIQKKTPHLCLIISKEPEESLDIFLSNWKGKVKIFDNFSVVDFTNEVETLSFFQEPLLCLVKEVDQLKDEASIILKYLKNPNPKISLLLTSTKPVFVKEIESMGGLVVQLSQEKPWQKKKRLELFLKEEAHKQQISFPSDAIQYLIELVGVEKPSLLSEFEKLKAFTSEKKAITVSDIKEVVAPRGLYTLWDLGESLFKKDVGRAVLVASFLLQEQSLFTILASLRTQIKTLDQMSSCYESGGESLLVKEFPYLKGAVLSKKIEEMRSNPISELKRGLYLLFEAELKARSANGDPLFILELFFGHYVTFTTEPTRTL